MKRSILGVILLVIISAMVAACGAVPAQQQSASSGESAKEEAPAAEAEEITIVMWTKEGEADGGLQFNQALAEAFTKENPNVTIDVIKKKDVEELREDFQTAALAGSSPDLLWTVNDHAGPFTAAELIQPVDSLFDLSAYVEGGLEAVKLDGKVWGVPISSGNHLMLLYNKSLIDAAPANTDEMIAKAADIEDGVSPLVFNQTEPFWMVPWLGGFDGKVFADDGVTPTLDTEAMVNTLQFLHDIKFENNLIPAESDYDGSDTLFKEGKAAMLINGDWSLASYIEALGDDLAVAPIPQVSSTGKMPAPYTAGTYFMIPEAVEGAKLDAVKDFVAFVTNEENQIKQVNELKRLPALKAAFEDDTIAGDPVLKGSVAQMAVGTGMPAVLEMRCNWDAMKPELQAVMSDSKTAEEAAADMQAAADACIKTLE